MKTVLCVLALAAMVGCAKQKEAEKTPTEKKSVQTAIEGATGKTAVNALKHAEKASTEAAARRNADVEAAMGE